LFFSVTTRRESIVDGMRTIALKLEFGAFHNQIFERFLHFHHSYILIDNHHIFTSVEVPYFWFLHTVSFSAIR
jgi:hypothetical protein